MRRVLLYSVLLLLGLGFSQALPTLAGGAFIMIHVGFEFHIDKSKPRVYGWDYLVAFTAASFPWILVTVYFILLYAGGKRRGGIGWRWRLGCGRAARSARACWYSA